MPGRNLFSFTFPDHPDVDAAWLFEVGAAALYARGGFPAVVLAKTAVLLAAFGLAFALCRRRGAGPAAAALALGAAAFAGRERFVERPHVLSLLGIVGLLFAIDALVGRSGKRGARVAAVTCAGVALWSNLHAGAFIAPVLLACAAGGARLDRDRGGAAGRLGLAALATAGALFATPLGFGLLRYLRLHLVLPALHPVDEFRSPSWLSDPALFVYVAAFLAACALGWRRFRWTEVLPVLAVALLAARTVRFSADFALAAAPLLAVGLSAAGDRVRARWPLLVSDPVPSVGVAALLAGMAGGPRLGGHGGGIGLDTRELPLSAIAFVDANGLRDRMYNDFEIGSYLLFDPAGGYPRHRVFVDPRLPAYPAEFHRLLGRSDLTRAEWGAAMDGFGVQTALLAYAGINPRVVLVGSRTLRARFSRSGRTRLRPPPAALRRADRPPRDPRDVRVLAPGRDRDAAAGKPAGRVARPRLRMAACGSAI